MLAKYIQDIHKFIYMVQTFTVKGNKHAKLKES